MTTRAPIRRGFSTPRPFRLPPPSPEDEDPAMYESDDFDRLEEYVTFDHPHTCGCRECDPDFYFDPAERDAGRPDPERRSPQD